MTWAGKRRKLCMGLCDTDTRISPDQQKYSDKHNPRKSDWLTMHAGPWICDTVPVAANSAHARHKTKLTVKTTSSQMGCDSI